MGIDWEWGQAGWRGRQRGKNWDNYNIINNKILKILLTIGFKEEFYIYDTYLCRIFCFQICDGLLLTHKMGVF